jgi:ATP-dependent helicase/nuclease subunit A
MIRHEQIGMIEPYYSSIAKFTSSSLCARMVAAEKDHGRGPFREIPFSITVPAGHSDVSLVQGMIDCWFIENGNAILVDYKSDRIAGQKEDKARILQERYAVQLDYYAKAIEAATRMRVTERVIWLIPDGLSFLLEAPGRNLL